jgi:hypothetical protein
VSTVENINGTTTTGARLRVVTSAHAPLALMRAWSGLRVVRTAPTDVALQGTAVSTLAPTAVKANALLPISAVVVFGDTAGIRTWSPPV